MIKVTNAKVFNFEGAFRGLRNPKESHHLSDSFFDIMEDNYVSDYFDEHTSLYALPELPEEEYDMILNWSYENAGSNYLPYGEHCSEYVFLGPKDIDLAQRMIAGGTDESKFMRQILVSLDIEAPLFWWKEFDTYKVGTVANSYSTMRKLDAHPITADMFTFTTSENFDPDVWVDTWPDDIDDSYVNRIIEDLEWLRLRYKQTKNKVYWRLLVEKLPNGWMQKRTITLNYQVLRAMYFARKNHKLQEWRDFCNWIEELPYAKELICYKKQKEEN